MEGIKFEKVSFGSFLKDSLNCRLGNGLVRNPTDKDFSEFLKDVYDKISLPVRKTEGSAGYDIECPFSFVIKPGAKVKFPTGIKATMPKDIVLNIHIRSSLGIKHDLHISNTIGIIDSDYYNNPSNEGDIIISLNNDGQNNYNMEEYNAVAQGIFTKYEVTEDDNATAKRVGGIGSTSK